MRNGLILRLDTSKKGIETVFRPWQNEAVNLLVEAHEEHSSAEMLFRLTKQDFNISRASVINFMNGLVLLKLVIYREVTGKGGFRGIYKISRTRAEFNDKIENIFLDKMLEYRKASES